MAGVNLKYGPAEMRVKSRPSICMSTMSAEPDGVPSITVVFLSRACAKACA
jgi:hypothetical protein